MNDNKQRAGTEMQIPSQAEKIKTWTSLMPKIGLALMIIGFIMSVCFSYKFADTNLGLMIGFGFIIGGIQVLLLGSLFHALQPKLVKSTDMTAHQPLEHIQH
ncbi:hypothetical protein GZH47_02955 [Paenibacillus rhizovicinus]|uniref:Uncharacterized protein n=1 Tax=Paenibacillus rhizovicinus TaxID=2704463 RepID=A0A6C0NZJ0_9BACL|nr:hypothetical protein [Paenibacillus rhizovicinus]QHW29892.1 hypothetical protein GZH47_02955 [Paenibacillus rhizovicinus]